MNAHVNELLKMSRPAPFSYDHTTKLFTSGDTTYTPPELPLGFGDLAADHEVNEVPDTALVHGILRIVMLPKMYDWLQENASTELFTQASEIMHDVFTGLEPRMLGKVATHDPYSHWGFNVARLRPEHPHIVLTTLGDCACFGVEIDGIFGEHTWDQKVAEFGYHNVDYNPQKVSLLAGIGHIAHLANHS